MFIQHYRDSSLACRPPESQCTGKLTHAARRCVSRRTLDILSDRYENPRCVRRSLSKSHCHQRCDYCSLDILVRVLARKCLEGEKLLQYRGLCFDCVCWSCDGHECPSNLLRPSFYFDFGRNATICSGLVSSRGPPIRSMQYGMAGMTASRHSRMALGWPGRFTIRQEPRIPAV